MKKMFIISAYLLGFTISTTIYAADCIPALIVIRHAEDSKTDKNNVNLVPEGITHAKAYGELFKTPNKLNGMLKDNLCPIKEIYNFTTGKPRQTAEIIGGKDYLGISTKPWPPGKGMGQFPVGMSPKLTGGSVLLVLNRQAFWSIKTGPASPEPASFLAQIVTDKINKDKIRSAGSPQFNFLYIFKNQTLGGFNPFKNADIYIQKYTYGGKSNQCNLRLPSNAPQKITIDNLVPMPPQKNLYDPNESKRSGWNCTAP